MPVAEFFSRRAADRIVSNIDRVYWTDVQRLVDIRNAPRTVEDVFKMHRQAWDRTLGPVFKRTHWSNVFDPEAERLMRNNRLTALGSHFGFSAQQLGEYYEAEQRAEIEESKKDMRIRRQELDNAPEDEQPELARRYADLLLFVKPHADPEWDRMVQDFAERYGHLLP